MSNNNYDDALGKVWSLRMAVRRAQKYKDDPDFKARMGDDYADFVHWLAVTDKKLEEYNDELQGVTNTAMPDPPCCIVASAPPAAPPAAPGAALLDFEGPLGVAVAIGVTLLAGRHRPKPIPASAVTFEQKLDYATAQLRATLPVELAYDFMTNDIADIRVTVGMAAREAAKKAALETAASGATTASAHATEAIKTATIAGAAKAAVKAADHATEVMRLGAAGTIAAAGGAAAEDVKQLEKQLADALKIEKILPAIGIVTAITSRLNKLMPGGPPEQCKQDYSDYSRVMGRVNNALRTGDFPMAKKNWPGALKAALKVIACVAGTGGGGPPASGASGTPVPAH